jgi:broad specificity phosphatase PhoE
MYEIPEKIVYFVRHGQSEGNASAVFQSLDSPLSKIGKEQAEKIAERVSKLSFETLIASPLTRARETAGIIVKITGKQPEYSELFVERIKPTNLSGKPHSDKTARKLWVEWEKSLYTPGLRAQDEENFDSLILRTDKAIDFLTARPEKKLVVVTHGYFIRTIVARIVLGDALTPEVLKNFQSKMSSMENAGLTVITYGKTPNGVAWRLWTYNDHSHLG